MRPAIVVGLAMLASFLSACGGTVDLDEGEARRGGGSDATAREGTNTTPSMPTAPTRLPQPFPCVGHAVTWTTEGGWPGGRNASSTITSCRTYEHVFYPSGSNGVASRCSVELESAGSFTIQELTAAMEDPVVQSAFMRGGTIGKLHSAADGVDDLVLLHGGRLTIGYDVAKQLTHLVEVLRAIDERECPQG